MSTTPHKTHLVRFSTFHKHPNQHTIITTFESKINTTHTKQLIFTTSNSIAQLWALFKILKTQNTKKKTQEPTLIYTNNTETITLIYFQSKNIPPTTAKHNHWNKKTNENIQNNNHANSSKLPQNLPAWTNAYNYTKS